MIVAAWTVAILTLVVMLVATVSWLIRRGVRLLEALADFFAAPAILDGVHRAEPVARPVSSVLEPIADVRARRDAFRAAAHDRKQVRAIARHERGLDLIAPWRTH